MKLKEVWQGLISAFKLDCYTHKGDELHFPSEEEVAQYNKRLQDQRKAKELEWAEQGVPLVKKSIIEYALHGKNRCSIDYNNEEYRQFYALKWLWDEIVEWGEQEGILLSKEECSLGRFDYIWVSWERIK